MLIFFHHHYGNLCKYDDTFCFNGKRRSNIKYLHNLTNMHSTLEQHKTLNSIWFFFLVKHRSFKVRKFVGWKKKLH